MRNNIEHKNDCSLPMVDINSEAINTSTNATNNQLSKTPGRRKLRSWLNKSMKIEMTDGRILVGIFLCTDQDRNVILGSCSEFLKQDDDGAEEEPRVLGLAMVPGHHIVSISVDYFSYNKADVPERSKLPSQSLNDNFTILNDNI